MEEARESLNSTREQLKQVDLAISAGVTNEEIYEVRSQLVELIVILEQNLKSQEDDIMENFLKTVDPDRNGEEQLAANNNEQNSLKHTELMVADKMNDEFLESLSEVDELSSVKCRAPYFTEWNGEQYHNAMISNVICEKCVSVLFLNPIMDKMRPCKYFLENDCSYEDSTCKYSHGYKVEISKLHKYIAPDYENNFKENHLCLAKQENGLWASAVIESVNEENFKCSVSFTGMNLKSELSIDEVLPQNDCHFKNDDTKINDGYSVLSTSYCIKEPSYQINESKELGAWEKHTKGMGLKLMKKMGYTEGYGLGKNNQGRKIPVPIVILPPGKSLDYCVEQRKKKKISLNKKKSFENKESVKSGSVFTFLNQTIGGVKKPVKKPKSQKLTGSKRKDQQIRNQEIHVSISNKKKHIKQLEQQIERNKLTNPSVAEQFKNKLQKLRDDLLLLENKNTAIENQKKNEKVF